MGNKGPTRHMKRHQSPSFWPLHRKDGEWATKTQSGPHNQSTSMPVSVVIRDQFKYAKTAREAKVITKQGNIIINGKVRLDERFPVGLMDVLNIPTTNENFRILPDHAGKLKFLPITADEAKFRLVRIIGKTIQKAGMTQLNLHDGTNLNIKTEQDQYKINDVLKISIFGKEVQDYIEFKEMQKVIITGGRSQGAYGTLIGLGPEPGWKKTATIRTPEGEDIRTLSKYLFVVGSNEPIIKLTAGEE